MEDTKPRVEYKEPRLFMDDDLPSQPWWSSLTDPSFWILTSPGPDILFGADADVAPEAAGLLLPRGPFPSARQHW